MKVVINRCFGGFGLSAAAVRLYAQRKGRSCFFFGHERKSNGGIDLNKFRGPLTAEEAEAEFMFFAFDIPNPNKVVGTDKAFAEMPKKEKEAYSQAYKDHNLCARDIARNDPDLVFVVRKLGKRANGKHAELAIVSIPDDVEYTIEEYDGLEHVAEKHRTWS